MKKLIGIIIIVLILSTTLTNIVSDDVRVSGNISATGTIQADSAIHLFHYFGDSTITYTFALANTWYHLTNIYEHLWVYAEQDGFTTTGDVITLLNSGDYDFTGKLTMDGSNTQTYSLRLYNVTQAIGIPVSSGQTARGAGNFLTINIGAYCEGCIAGDEFIIQIKNDGVGSATLKSSTLKFYLIHR